MKSSRALALAVSLAVTASAPGLHAMVMAPTPAPAHGPNHPVRLIMYGQGAPGSVPVVVSNLEAHRQAWRVYLTAQRETNLARLQAYGDAGVFPINSYRPGKLNVMIDRTGRLCAVAHLMELTGDRAMVDEASARDNTLRFSTVSSGAIRDWITASGFTNEEIALIQEPYFNPGGDDPNVRGVPRVGTNPDPQRVIDTNMLAEQQRLIAYFDALVPRLQQSTENSVETAVTRLGNKVFQDPPAVR